MRVLILAFAFALAIPLTGARKSVSPEREAVKLLCLEAIGLASESPWDPDLLSLMETTLSEFSLPAQRIPLDFDAFKQFPSQFLGRFDEDTEGFFQSLVQHFPTPIREQLRTRCPLQSEDGRKAALGVAKFYKRVELRWRAILALQEAWASYEDTTKRVKTLGTPDQLKILGHLSWNSLARAKSELSEVYFWLNPGVDIFAPFTSGIQFRSGRANFAGKIVEYFDDRMAHLDPTIQEQIRLAAPLTPKDGVKGNLVLVDTRLRILARMRKLTHYHNEKVPAYGIAIPEAGLGSVQGIENTLLLLLLHSEVSEQMPIHGPVLASWLGSEKLRYITALSDSLAGGVNIKSLDVKVALEELGVHLSDETRDKISTYYPVESDDLSVIASARLKIIHPFLRLGMRIMALVDGHNAENLANPIPLPETPEQLRTAIEMLKAAAGK